MADLPGMVIPSKLKKNYWTYTVRRGTVENHEVVVAEDEDPSRVYDRAVLAKSAMRDACGKKKVFIGVKNGLPR